MIDYTCFNPKVTKPRYLLERKEARQAYDLYIDSIPERIDILNKLLIEYGCEKLQGADSLEDIHSIYYNTCSKNTPRENLTALELSIASDLGMFMGNLAIKNCDTLFWKLHTFGKTDFHYQSPVIMGFKNTKIPKYSINFEFVINSYGHRIISGKPKEKLFFSKLYSSCMEIA